MLVLVIDDDLDDQELFAEAINTVNANTQCLTESNGADALELLNSLTVLPDFIFVDINMPLMNGTQFLTAIKNNSQLASIPCIVFSTSLMGREENLLELGAHAVHSKPTSYYKLIEVVGGYIPKS